MSEFWECSCAECEADRHWGRAPAGHALDGSIGHLPVSLGEVFGSATGLALLSSKFSQDLTSFITMGDGGDSPTRGPVKPAPIEVSSPPPPRSIRRDSVISTFHLQSLVKVSSKGDFGFA